jgi:hypothetical protein
MPNEFNSKLTLASVQICAPRHRMSQKWRLYNCIDGFMIMKMRAVGKFKTSTIVSLTLAAALLGSVAAHAQSEQSAAHHHVHHHYSPNHALHHRYMARGPATAPGAATAAVAPAPQAGPFGLALPRIAPYPAGKGDGDGLSEDQNDCNKGCIGGNGPD